MHVSIWSGRTHFTSVVVGTLSRYRRNDESLVAELAASWQSAANDSSLMVSPSDGLALCQTLGDFQSSSRSAA